MSVDRNERTNPWAHRPRWLGYVAVIVLEAALTAGLLWLMPYFPIGNYPIPYILVTLVVAYVFAEGPAILSVFLGWFLFTYFFVPPAGISWPPAHSVEGWAQQIALILGVTVVAIATTQARKSNRRIQRLADESLRLNANLKDEIAERRRTEEALRDSEARLRATFDNAGVGILEADSEDRFISANDRVLEILGYSREELIGMTVHELTAPEDRPRSDEMNVRLHEGDFDRFDYEKRYRRRDGSSLWAHVTVSAIRDTDGRFIRAIATVEDITARKQAEAALRESEQSVRRKLDSILSPEGDIGSLELADILDVQAIQSLMESFYRLSPIPMAMIDLEGKVLVGVGWQDVCVKFHRVNPETCRHCIESDTELTAEVPAGEFKLYKCKNNMWDVATPIVVGGQHVGNLFTGQFLFDDDPLDYDFFRSQARQYGFDEEAYIAALESVPRFSRETLDEAMSFFMKLADMLSKLSYGNIKLARSLSERDALMDSLKESGERLSRAQEIAHLGSWELDIESNVLTWSDEVYRIFGLRPQEFGASYEAFLDAVHPDDREAVNAAYSNSVREGRSSYEIEHRIVRRATGEVRWVQERCEHFKDETGNIVRSVGMVLDITDRKRVEEEIRQLNAELEQRVEQRTEELEAANKELEAFSYSVSHDLRAPLRAIDGFSNAILKHYHDSLDPKGQDYLQRVRAAANRMANLIDDILGLSRATRAEMNLQSVDMSAMAAEIFGELKKSQPRRKAEITIAPGLVVNADAHLLRIALDNMLGNAWKFTGERKTAVIELGAFKLNGERVYYIRDNGAGFNPAYADKLFSPFQRLHTESEFPGTGIGLALVQRILRRHGGRIWAEGDEDQGATFYFTLGEADR